MSGPARPFTEKGQIQALNGCPVFLGTLVSTGSAVNNLTTATPFNATPLGAVATSTGGANMAGSLAGKTLLLQSTGAGFLLPSNSSAVTITNQSGLVPGVLVASGVTQIIVMVPTYGWMQWLPQAGSANLLVWELI